MASADVRAQCRRYHTPARSTPLHSEFSRWSPLVTPGRNIPRHDSSPEPMMRSYRITGGGKIDPGEVGLTRRVRVGGKGILGTAGIVRVSNSVAEPRFGLHGTVMTVKPTRPWAKSSLRSRLPARLVPECRKPTADRTCDVGYAVATPAAASTTGDWCNDAGPTGCDTAGDGCQT